MNTFIKTFFICLIAALCFIGYKFLGNDSFDNNLYVSKKNPVFTTEKKDSALIKNTNDDKTQDENSEDGSLSDTSQVFNHICYFYSKKGQLIPITRKISSNASLEATIQLLLKGPTIQETKEGIYSEIPAQVDLISIKNDKNSVIVNLSQNFGNGGGTQSVENRVKQLAKTVKSKKPNKSVYLYINGKEVEYLGGEGVYIKQPL